jgi:hypothetical protein
VGARFVVARMRVGIGAGRVPVSVFGARVWRAGALGAGASGAGVWALAARRVLALVLAVSGAGVTGDGATGRLARRLREGGAGAGVATGSAACPARTLRGRAGSADGATGAVSIAGWRSGLADRCVRDLRERGGSAGWTARTGAGVRAGADAATRTGASACRARDCRGRAGLAAGVTSATAGAASAGRRARGFGVGLAPLPAGEAGDLPIRSGVAGEASRFEAGRRRRVAAVASACGVDGDGAMLDDCKAVGASPAFDACLAALVLVVERLSAGVAAVPIGAAGGTAKASAGVLARAARRPEGRRAGRSTVTGCVGGCWVSGATASVSATTAGAVPAGADAIDSRAVESDALAPFGTGVTGAATMVSAAGGSVGPVSTPAAEGSVGAGATSAALRRRRGRAGSSASSRPTQKWCLRTDWSATTVIAGSANSSSGLTWQQLAGRPKRSAKRVAASARRSWGVTRRSASYQRSPSFMAHSHGAYAARPDDLLPLRTSVLVYQESGASFTVPAATIP